jgi:protein SCO1/2
MAELAQYKTELGLGSDQVRTIFVTVDPDRDTRQALTDYLGSFDPAIIGLYGDAAATAKAKASFGVFSENGPKDAKGSYVVNHTATVFLMGRNGEFEGTIDYGEAKASAIAKIKRLVQG